MINSLINDPLVKKILLFTYFKKLEKYENSENRKTHVSQYNLGRIPCNFTRLSSYTVYDH